MKPSRRWYAAPRGLLMAAATTLMVMAAILFISCGGETESTPPEATTPSPGAGVVPPLDPNVSLVEFRSPDKGYSLGYPEGWEVETSPGAGTDFFFRKADDRRLALLQVTCNRELRTAELLMTVDQNVASNFGGVLDPSAAAPVEVGGVEGIQNRYSITIGGGSIEHVVAYVAAGDCGWRIGLNSYGSGTLEPYLPLFQRILASFHFD